MVALEIACGSEADVTARLAAWLLLMILMIMLTQPALS
jgi:hypothetical protein